MAKTVIVGDDTVRELIEAYASLSAWFYQMSDALRQGGVGCEPPSEAHRRAYVAQLAVTYPELSAVAAGLTAPRPFLPPPVIAAPFAAVENEGVELKPPPPPPSAEAGPLPPSMVEPGAVRY